MKNKNCKNEAVWKDLSLILLIYSSSTSSFTNTKKYNPIIKLKKETDNTNTLGHHKPVEWFTKIASKRFNCVKHHITNPNGAITTPIFLKECGNNMENFIINILIYNKQM